MMKLSFEQIKEIILNRPNGYLVDLAVKKHEKLNMHVNGVGAEKYISSLKKYENEAQREAHEMLLEPNNALFKSVLNPTQKVFSAKGFSRQYNLRNETQKTDFKNLLSDVAHGLPLKDWLHKKIFNKYITDPNGIVFVEVSQDGEKATPTFKSITSIYDISYSGQKVDYIVFNPIHDKEDSNKKYYRVVDDSNDYWIISEKKGEDLKISIDEEQTLVNYFGKCPAIVVSDIFDNVVDIKKSFIEETLPKATKFFFDNTIHTVHKLLHGFPKYWEYGDDCEVCEGTGVVKNSNQENIKCGVCNGTGKRPFGDVSDKIVLPFPEDKDDPILTKLAGFESPDIATWQEYKKDIQDHKDDIFSTLWNTNYVRSQKSQTATESVLNVQPINEKLHYVSDNFERIELFVTNLLGSFYYSDTYQGASINYGRRYLVESTDVVFNKLTKAIESRMPTAFIFNTAKEYIQSLYCNNEVEISVQMKLFEIEPFPFMSISDVKALDVSTDDYTKKIYYQEWLKNKTDAEKMLMTKTDLTTDFEEFINQKQLKINEGNITTV